MTGALTSLLVRLAVILLAADQVYVSCLRPSKSCLRKRSEPEAEEEQRPEEGADAGSSPGDVLIPFPVAENDLASSGADDSQSCEATLDTGLLHLQTVYEYCLGSVPFYVKDCCQLNYLGFNNRSGIYGVRGELAYCDMEADGGGWMVIVRRVPKRRPGGPGRSFAKTWRQYERGFGVLDRNFWQGLRRMHLLTTAQPMELRVDLTFKNGTKVFAHYENFYVAGPESKYRLTIEGYDPNSTVIDSLSGNNGSMFSTRDQDNDRIPRTQCANVCPSGACGGGWWYGGGHNGRIMYCYLATLTTVYHNSYTKKDQYGINWFVGIDMGYYGEFTHAEMKIRPKEWHCRNMYSNDVNGNVPFPTVD